MSVPTEQAFHLATYHRQMETRMSLDPKHMTAILHNIHHVSIGFNWNFITSPKTDYPL